MAPLTLCTGSCCADKGFVLQDGKFNTSEIDAIIEIAERKVEEHFSSSGKHLIQGHACHHCLYDHCVKNIMSSMPSDTISTKQPEGAAISGVAFMVDCTPDNHSCCVCFSVHVEHGALWHISAHQIDEVPLYSMHENSRLRGSPVCLHQVRRKLPGHQTPRLQTGWKNCRCKRIVIVDPGP